MCIVGCSNVTTYFLIFRDETDDINLDIVPHINMANRSASFSMLQNNPTKDYDEPPDSLRKSTYILGDNSDGSFESEYEQQERNEIPSASEVAPQMLLSSTPLESSSNSLIISDSSTMSIPGDSKVAKKDHEQKNEFSSSPNEYNHPDNGSPQDESLAFTDAKSDNTAMQKNIQDHMHEDEMSSDDSELYINEGLGPVLHMVQEKSPYLEIIAKDGKAVGNYDNSEYYEWCEVRKLVTAHGPVAAATTKSGASAESQSHDWDTKGTDTDDTNEQSTYDDVRSLTTNNKQPSIPELRHVDSTTSNYVRMYKVKHSELKRDSDVYTYDCVCHSYIEMCRRRRRCTGVPPRRIKRIGYQPPIYTNITAIKENETYVNFRITEQHTISLPPRENHKRPTPKQRTNYKPPMPPRNIPRPRCYLNAPPAVPKL